MARDPEPLSPVGGVETVAFAQVPVVATDRVEAARRLIAWLGGRRGASHVHLVNAYSIALASTDPALSAVFASGVCLPDGKPLGWIARWLRGVPTFRQVRGPQLFLDVMDGGRDVGLRHFLLGSTEETLQRLRTELERRYPGVEIVGTHSPPFRPLTDEDFVAQDSHVLTAAPTVVWVGLGTPKQDFEALRIARDLGLPAVAVGAAFDFTAGVIEPAPEWMSACGLEWFYRLIREPRRLWRRYLFGNLRFLWVAMRPSSKRFPHDD
ncbi:MAG TPA: WecB/TagA/CpsF family glycosyltransferase [Nocardioides sp.]|uniref:WecB/TagA/CpsF family glycosyltransferase n=1 Tax=Nocardioides sp. TaxID=35761 RepID=UPI002ED7FA6E